MLIYIMCVLMTTFMAIFTENKKINKWLAIVLVTIPLACVSGFRWKVGTDYGNYYYSFNQIPYYKFTLFFSTEYSNYSVFERGFSFIVWMVGLVNKNPHFVMFMISFINVGLVIYTIKKYSSKFSFSIYLYMTTMIYFSAFNGIRQWMASIIIFCGYRFLVERKTKKFILLVLLASLVHTTAIFMIPVYFIIDSKPFGKKMLITTAIVLCISAALVPFLSNMSSFVSETKYEGYMSISENDDGVNVFKVLVAFVPVAIAFNFQKKLREDKDGRILVNISIINFLILVLSMQNTIFARFCFYTEIYNLLLYAKFINLFKEKERYIFVFMVMICYFMYMYLVLPFDSNLLPYRVFWQA